MRQHRVCTSAAFRPACLALPGGGAHNRPALSCRAWPHGTRVHPRLVAAEDYQGDFIIMRITSVAAAGALLLLAAVPAAAQQSWTDLVDYVLGETSEALEQEGYRFAGFAHQGALEQGERESVALRLSAGSDVMLLGICDVDCDDLDLAILDTQGERIDIDTKVDDSPIVAVTPKRTGLYTVGVQMAGCSAQPCRYAIQAFAR